MNPIRNLVLTNEFLEWGQKTMNNLPKISNGTRKLLFFLIVVSFLTIGGAVKAGAGDNVSGWAWSNMDDPTTLEDERSIGWISFNSTNCDSNEDGVTDAGKYPQCPVGQSVANYGVNINSDGTFSGYAWASTTGWIGFTPSGPYPSSPNHGVEMNTDSGEVSGWARVCSVFQSGCSGALRPNVERGDWEGWIKLAGNGASWNGSQCTGTNDYGNTNRCNWGVKINLTNGDFSGYAWSDMIIGWISFKGVNYVVKTTFSFNKAPTIEPGSQIIEYQSYCIAAFPGQGQIGFKWNYLDQDNDQEYRFDFQADNNSNFSSPEVDRRYCNLTPTTPASPRTNNQAVNVVPSLASSSRTYCSGTPDQYTVNTPDAITYNTVYYWRVKVWDSTGRNSGWVDGTFFSTKSHAYPFPDFTHQPQTPAAGEEISFIDSSICYDSGGSPYFCKTNTGNRYQWDFEDDGQIDCDSNINSACRGDVAHIYPAIGDYTTRLYATDDVGTCNSTGDTPITTQLPLPEYKEVPPVIWLKNILLAFINFYNSQKNF